MKGHLAFSPLIGITLLNVNKLNLLRLAPGGHVGRFCIWTESAFRKLDDLYGTWRKPATLKSSYKWVRFSLIFSFANWNTEVLTQACPTQGAFEWGWPRSLFTFAVPFTVLRSACWKELSSILSLHGEGFLHRGIRNDILACRSTFTSAWTDSCQYRSILIEKVDPGDLQHKLWGNSNST